MTTILYIFATMWAVGILALAGYFLFPLEDRLVKAVAVCFVVPIASFMIFVPFSVIHRKDSPILATLRKGEWSCTDSRVATSMVMVGKVMFPRTTRVCVEYRSVR